MTLRALHPDRDRRRGKAATCLRALLLGTLLGLCASPAGPASAQENKPGSGEPAPPAGEPAPASAPPRDELFRRGVEAFERGDFGESRGWFEAIVEAGGLSPDVFFNLGNAFYRLDDPGRAALQYRRALVLDPRHPEARQNLRFLRRETGFIDLQAPPLAPLADLMPSGRWITVLSVAAWLAILGIAAAVLARSLRIPRTPAVVLVVAGLVVTSGAALALGSRRFLETSVDHRFVVVAPDVAARTAPATGSDEVMRLPPGSEVGVVEQRGSWRYVSFPDPSDAWTSRGRELRGWISAEALEPLWPFDPALVD